MYARMYAVYMYVCMYAYTFVYIYICLHTHTHTYTAPCINNIWIFKHKCKSVSLSLSVSVSLYIYIALFFVNVSNLHMFATYQVPQTHCQAPGALRKPKLNLDTQIRWQPKPRRRPQETVMHSFSGPKPLKITLLKLRQHENKLPRRPKQNLSPTVVTLLPWVEADR